MMKVVAVLILAVVSLSGFGAFEIAVRDKPAPVCIVVPEPASASQSYAAEELASYVAKLTEVRLEIVSATAEKLKDNRLRTVRLVTADPMAGLGESGFRLRMQGRGTSSALVIEGSAERGCLYGVYELLERFGGVRWYASDFAKVPRLETLAVPEDLDVTEKPAFAMREPFWLDVSRDPAFAARCKVNTFSRRATPVDAKYGGDAYRFGRKLGSCHTLRTLLPWETYFKDHPEYFALVDGERRGGYNEQVCLTHPDVFRIVLSNLLEHIRRDPDARFYGVSQNDSAGDNGCQCAKCLAVDAEEDSRAGTYVRFINAIAEAVEKEFPGVLIETLAYRYTRKPPKKTRLRHNVVPCLCTIECDFGHPIATGTYPENVSFREDIRGWAAQTDQLYVWDYVTNFRHYMGTFPNGRVLQDNLKFFRDNKVKMIFEQGDYQGDHGDFAELKAWLIAKLSWNPDQPLEPLLDDFFNGYYGKAAKYVRADYDALAAAYAAKPDVPLSIYDDLELAAVPESYYDDALARHDAALARTKDDPIHAANVRAWAFTIAFTRAYRYHLLPEVKRNSPTERAAALRCAREALKEINAHPAWFLSEAFGKWINHRRDDRKVLLRVLTELDEESVRWPTIMPLADRNEAAIAADARWLVKNTIADSVAWCCTLVPEGGAQPTDKAAVYAARYRKMQPLMPGVRQGILFQATVGHGWTPGKPTGWQKMVTRDGSEPYKFCPLGAEFRAYLADQAKKLAALKPDFFMVDDDTRYITGFDACFCPLHLAGFSTIAKPEGASVWTREALVAALARDALLAAQWDDYLRDTMAPLMETVRAAFPSEIPGEFCCCAHDAHHAAHHAAILAGPGHPPVVRLNNSLYLEDGVRGRFLRRWSETAWQLNDIGPDAIVLDEADPCPQNRYSMDATRLLHHAAMGLFAGCRGAKLWLTRLGNVQEVESGRAYRELFAAKRGWLEGIAALGFRRAGVVIPLPNKRKVDQHLPGWLSIDAFDWGTTVFGRMGIPHRYGNPVARDEVVAMNEQTVSYLEDGEIEWYLKGACLLDGGAAEALTKRGFGKMIGVEAKPWTGPTICAERFATETLNVTVNRAADLRAVAAGAETTSRYDNRPSALSDERTEVAPGSIFFANADGGRIATFASHLVPEQHLGRIDWYNETRKRALVATLRRLNGGSLPGGVAYAGDAEIVCLSGTAADGRRIVVLDNLNLDDVANPEILFDGMPDRILRLAEDGTWMPVSVAKTARGFAPVVTLRTYRPEVLSVAKSSLR